MNKRQELIAKTSTYALYCAVCAMPFSLPFCHVMLIVFVVASLFDKPIREKIIQLKHNYHLIALLGFLTAIVFSITYSENLSEGLFALEKKAFFFLLPFTFASSTIITPHIIRRVGLLFCISCAAALMVCYINAGIQYQSFMSRGLPISAIDYLASSDLWKFEQGNEGWMFFSYVALASGVKMHPTYLSMYVAFSTMIMLDRLLSNQLSRWQSIVFLVVVIFFTGSIVLLSSRVVLLALSAFLVIALFYKSRTWTRNVHFMMVAITLMFIMIAGTLVNPVTRYRQLNELSASTLKVSENTVYSNSTGIRISLWWLSAKAYLNSNPLIGAGIGDIIENVKSASEQYGVRNVLNSYNPHNQFLFFLIGTGALGLLLFLTYLTLGILKAWNYRDMLALGFLFLFVCVCVTETVLELQRGVIFFSIFFSIFSFSASSPKISYQLTSAKS